MQRDSTIGEGIAFVDPERLEEEKRLVAESQLSKRKVNEQLVLERRLAQESYEKEIQEKQYKRLMHLLSQSKALSNYILKKVEDTKKDGSKKDDTKKPKTKKQALKRQPEVVDLEDNPPPKKRGRKPSLKKLDAEVVAQVIFYFAQL